MITAPTRIDFLDPNMQHPKDDITVNELANKLEEQYGLLHAFIALHKRDIEKIIVSEMVLAIKHDDTNVNMDEHINGRVQRLWQVYIMNEEHGIKTKAAELDNRQSFVDSGTYMNAMTIGVFH
jgi:hypothetical protein